MNEPTSLQLRLLGVPVLLVVPRCLSDQMRTALCALDPTAAAEHPQRGAPPALRLCRDGQTWALHGEAGATSYGEDPVGLVVTALTEVAVRHTALLGVHAGVLAGPAGTVVLPGPSGLGKSTLVACALREGFGYLSDEVLAVDRATGTVCGFARPLALDATGWRLAGLPVGGRPEQGAERIVRPEDLGMVGRPAAVSDVVIVRRAARAAACLQPGSPADAVAALLRHAFNHYRDPAASFARVTAIVRSARVWRGVYSDARELAAVLATRLTETVGTSSGRG